MPPTLAAIAFLSAAPSRADENPCAALVGAHLADSTIPTLGFSTDRPSKSAALEAATEAAKANYEARHCGSGREGDLRCLVAQANGTAPASMQSAWEEGGWPKRRWAACAVHTISAESHDRIIDELEGLPLRLEALGTRIAQSAEGRGTVRVDTPVWRGSGCGAAPFGAAIQGYVLHGLVQGGATLASKGGAADLTVTLELASLPTGLLVIGSTRAVATCERLPDQSQTVSPDLLRIPANFLGTCANVNLMSLVGGARGGGSCLGLDLVPPDEDGLLCPGDPVVPWVTARKPARVMLLDIGSDGKAWKFWPETAAGYAPWKDLTAAETQAAVYVPGMGEEMWVAVAVPDDRMDATGSTWSGYCRVSDVFSPSLIDPAAEVDVVTFRVRPPGDPACAGKGGDKNVLGMEVLMQAPMCFGRGP